MEKNLSELGNEILQLGMGPVTGPKIPRDKPMWSDQQKKSLKKKVVNMNIVVALFALIIIEH